MTSTAFIVITFILAALGIVCMFVPRLPAVVASFAALVCAHLAGAVYVDAKILIFWGVAAALVLGLHVLQPKALIETRSGHAYVALGALAGVALGYAVSSTAASIIIGGAVAAFLGAVAYMRTPAAPGFPVNSGRFVEYLCAKGLPAVVCASMSAISIASVL